MKLIYDLDGERESKCYYLHDDGKKEYIDFWSIKIDTCGHEMEFNAWEPQKTRSKNYSKLNEMRNTINE